MKFHGRDRGATLPIVALTLPVLIIMTGFAVDLGRLRASRRTMQARADIVALDLVRLADGRSEWGILNGAASDPIFVGTGGYPQYLAASAARNDVAVSQLQVVWGTWTEPSGFVSCGTPPGTPPPQSATTCYPDAVEVTARESTTYYFQPGNGNVTRVAVAALTEPVVDLTVGSVAAGFQSNIPDSAGLNATVYALNARLAAQFGATIPNPGSAGFDLVGYRGMATGFVDIRRVAANAGFGTPDELLDSDITVGQFFNATAAALDQQAAEGDPNAAGAAAQLRRFQTQMALNNNLVMHLGNTLDFEQGGDDAAANTSMNVLDLMTGGAEVINGVNFVSYQLSPGIPGVATATASHYLIERERTEFGLSVGGTAENKQMRFQVVLQVAPLVGMTQPVYIPLVIEAATALGTVDRLECGDPLQLSEAEIRVDTSLVTARIGTAADLSADSLVVQRGLMINSNGLTVDALLSLGLSLTQILGLTTSGQTTGSASASLIGASTQLVFNPHADPNPWQRAWGGIGASSLGAQLSSSLNVQLANDLLGTTATTNLTNQLSYVFNNLDTLVINPLLAASGVTVAGADVLADNLECDGAGLKLVA
jgi:uncharacterized membrane protein